MPAASRRDLLVAPKEADQLLVDPTETAEPRAVRPVGADELAGARDLGGVEVCEPAVAGPARGQDVVGAVPLPRAANAALLSAHPEAQEEGSLQQLPPRKELGDERPLLLQLCPHSASDRLGGDHECLTAISKRLL